MPSPLLMQLAHATHPRNLALVRAMPTIEITRAGVFSSFLLLKNAMIATTSAIAASTNGTNLVSSAKYHKMEAMPSTIETIDITLLSLFIIIPPIKYSYPKINKFNQKPERKLGS